MVALASEARLREPEMVWVWSQWFLTLTTSVRVERSLWKVNRTYRMGTPPRAERRKSSMNQLGGVGMLCEDGRSSLDRSGS